MSRTDHHVRGRAKLERAERHDPKRWKALETDEVTGKRDLRGLAPAAQVFEALTDHAAQPQDPPFFWQVRTWDETREWEMYQEFTVAYAEDGDKGSSRDVVAIYAENIGAPEPWYVAGEYEYLPESADAPDEEPAFFWDALDFPWHVTGGTGRVARTEMSTPGVRVHELAREVGLTTARLIEVLRTEVGEYATCAAYVVPTPIVRQVRARFTRTAPTRVLAAIDAMASAKQTSETRLAALRESLSRPAPGYDTRLDPISPDFDPSTWA